MANGDDKVVQLPDGRTVAFPSTMSDDEISSVIKTKLAPRAEPPEFVQRIASLAMKAKAGLPQPERMSGLPSRAAVALDPTGGALATSLSPAGRQGIVNAARVPVEAGKQFVAGAREGGGFSPAAGGANVLKESVVRPMAEQLSMATDEKRSVLERIGRATAGSIPLVGPYAATVGERLSGEAPLEGAIETGAELATGAGLFKSAAALAKRPISPSPLSEPFEKVKPQIDAVMHDRSLAVQKHVSQIGEAFKGEAQMKMDAASKAADAANPAGIPKQPVQDGIRADLGEVVKVPEKIPASLQKILSGPTLEQATVFRGQGAQGRGVFSPPGATNLSELPPVIQEQIRARLNLPEIEAQRPIPTSESWTHEQLKQLRTDLGNELFGRNRASMAPAVRKAANNAYHRITNALQENAARAGAENGALWADGVGQFRKYMEDFERSPVRRITSGKNATDITGPLLGKTTEQVRRILRQYADYGYKEGAVRQETSLVQRGKDAIQRGKLTKFDLGILSATTAGLLLHPGSVLGLAYEAGRIGIPKIQQRALAASGAKRGTIETNAKNEAIRKELAARREQR